MMKETFTEMLERYNGALAAEGVGCSSRLYKLQRAAVIIRKHEFLGKDEPDDSVIADYILDISKRESAGEISHLHACNLRRETERFIGYAKNGEVKIINSLLGARTVLCPEFQKVANNFLLSDFAQFSSSGKPIARNTHNDIRWIVYKYFDWLNKQGFTHLNKVGDEQIRKFLLFCSETMAIGSVHNARIYMAKLYAYLYKAGLSASSFGALLSFKVNRGSTVPKIHRADELSSLLETIERRTVDGKRAYAVMLLGIVLGLRAIDIINLKLSDIDWVKGEVRLLQTKTAVSVILPLTKDVGEALQDYILHARPKSNSPYVFLKLRTPYTELKSAVSIGEIYEKCCKEAGLPETKRFHTLRRSLGTAMLASGEPVTMVAQVLGHAEVESTKKYIAVDIEHLKLCALSFEGIKPKGGVRK